MVDLTFQLGRDVPTPREILEVIRPDLRLAAVIGPVVNFAFTASAMPADACLEGGDQAVYDAVFNALRDDALSNVKDWAGDMGKVYDRDKLAAFVAEALNECMNGEPSEAVIDVLDLDEGVCENIGMVANLISRGGVGEPYKRLADLGATFLARI